MSSSKMSEYKTWFMTLSPTRQQIEINKKNVRLSYYTKKLDYYTKRAATLDYLIRNELWLNITEEDIIEEFGIDFIEKPKKMKRSIFNFFKQKDVSSCYV